MKDKAEYDVVAVDLKSNTVRLIATGKTGSEAVAIERMAVQRRGVGVEFFACAPAGLYSGGDKWRGPHSNMPTEPTDERRGSIVRVGNMWFPDGPRGLQR